jgi:hypothetical protein
MMRRVRRLVVALVLFAPVVVSAGQGESDPNGLVSSDPMLVAWFDSIVRVLVVYLGF